MNAERILKALKQNPVLLWDVLEGITDIHVAGPWERWSNLENQAEASYIRMSPPSRTVVGSREQLYLASVVEWSSHCHCWIHPEGGDKIAVTVQDRRLAFQWVNNHLQEAGYLLVGSDFPEPA